MVIALDPELEARLVEAARRRGIAPGALALEVLREKLPKPAPPLEPRDEWERRLLAGARDYGVSLPHSALTSEALYE